MTAPCGHGSATVACPRHFHIARRLLPVAEPHVPFTNADALLYSAVFAWIDIAPVR
jgi:hypothetical protein